MDLPNVDWEGIDKRGAAVHEAGHIVVAAIHDRVFYGAHIMRTETDDPVGERTWIGRAQGFNPAGIRSAAMSVAGFAAEALDDDPLTSADECVDSLETGEEMSPTDMQYYPSDRAEQIQAFEDALQILRTNKVFLDWVTTQLLNDESGVVTDGMVQEYMRENTQ